MKSEPGMKLLMLALAASCWVAPLRAMAQSQGASIRVLEHIRYGVEAPEAQMLNAYLVQRETPTAAVVQILSGGWNSTPSQRVNVEPFRPYLDAGISVIVAAHRPVGKDVHWPVPGNDIARAIQFVRSRAGEWGIDPNRIAVKGRAVERVGRRFDGYACALRVWLEGLWCRWLT